jgi:hypothetical protein
MSIRTYTAFIDVKDHSHHDFKAATFKVRRPRRWWFLWLF